MTVALPLGIWKFKFVVKLQNKIKNRTIFVKKKFHSHGWMDVVIITKVAQSVQHLLSGDRVAGVSYAPQSSAQSLVGLVSDAVC